MFSDLHAWTFPVSISYPARSPKVRRGLTVMSEIYAVAFFEMEFDARVTRLQHRMDFCVRIVDFRDSPMDFHVASPFNAP